jgi:vancomycin resistance protein YoaR
MTGAGLRLFCAGTAFLALAAVGLAGWMVAVDRLYTDRVLPGVTLEGVPVGGLTVRDLHDRVHVLAAPTLGRPVTVRFGARSNVLTAEELGMRPAVDRTVAAVLAAGRSARILDRVRDRLVMLRRPASVTILYEYDQTAAQAAATRLAATISAEPRDATVQVVAGRLVVVTASQDGVVMDPAESAARIIGALTNRRSSVNLPADLRRPVLTTEEAGQMADPIARFTTRFPYNPDRIHNIRQAAGALRGRLLVPNAVLSYNEVVGPRDPAHGYRKAPILYGDILVPGDGGGVCQVSSTLFNAALLAEMAVESRTNHSQPVAYLPPGRDATVDYGVIDLRLRNASGHPLFLWTEVGPGSLTVTVFGVRRPGRDVAIEVTDRVWIPAPTNTVTVRDPMLAEGETKIDPPRQGLRARTVRVIRQDGVLVGQEVVGLSVYRPIPQTIRIGAKPRITSRAGARTTAP